MIWTIGQVPELDHLKPAERAALLARVPRWTYPLLIAGSLVVQFTVIERFRNIVNPLRRRLGLCPVR